jgi:hypothetical protein
MIKVKKIEIINLFHFLKINRVVKLKENFYYLINHTKVLPDPILNKVKT